VAVNLSIKRVPDRIVAKLRRRAMAHHRSMQGELLSLLEEAVEPGRLTVEELRREIKKLGLSTPDEGTAMVREDRDARQGRHLGSGATRPNKPQTT
jgi:plasmid stability protein